MTGEEERGMVGSELLRMLTDVANREVPCQVAYADILKRLAAARAEGAEQERERIRKESQFVTGSKNSDNDVYYCPNEDVYIVDASVLAPKEKGK
jgi:hypothetical protein